MNIFKTKFEHATISGNVIEEIINIYEFLKKRIFDIVFWKTKRSFFWIKLKRMMSLSFLKFNKLSLKIVWMAVIHKKQILIWFQKKWTIEVQQVAAPLSKALFF